MLEFSVKVGTDGRMYLKPEFRRLLRCENGERDVRVLAGTMVIVFAPQTATTEQVLRSLDALRADLQDEVTREQAKQRLLKDYSTTEASIPASQ